ncbi:MAG: ATP-dependent helicase [Acidobacteriota bacterium]
MSRKYTIKTDLSRHYTIDYRKELNEEQYRVVTAASGPILVIAGAGSGKTRTVTYRVARLLESGVGAENILLVTFTNRAAREMIARVEALTTACSTNQARRVWGGTFHHIANRILRRHAISLGYTNNYTIFDTQDVKDLLDTCVQVAGINIKLRRFPKGEVLQDIFSLSVNTGQSILDIVLTRYPYFEALIEEIEKVSGIYHTRKQTLNAMDYDDLLINWKRLLIEKPDIAHIYGEQFTHILVDEYQDTNLLQADIIDLLARQQRNVMVVGDDAQSIYRWRGAHFENIYSFKSRYPDAAEYRLETNYRSTPQILAVANHSIAHNKRQFEKQLRAVRGQGTLPALVPLRDSHQQSQFVASRLLELREEGISLGEMAVLYRSHYQSLQCGFELTRRGIPYVVRSGLRFFEQAHIKDVAAYLRLLVNPRDELAWVRVLKLIPKVGKATSKRIWDRVSVTEDPLALVRTGRLPEIRGSAVSGWQEFVQLINALTKPELIDSPARQIELILEHSYGEHVCYAYDNAEARLEDLRQLAHFAAQYQSTESFLSELTLINAERFSPPGGAKGENVITGADEDEKLTLSSIHQAKGLEWRVVFLIGCADGQFPSARSLRTSEDLEEERRLFYVALTRAQDELYVTYPIVDTNYAGQTVIQKPARFITELTPELFEIWQVEEDVKEGSSAELIN